MLLSPNSCSVIYETLNLLSYFITEICRQQVNADKHISLSSAIVADLLGHADTRMVETPYARTLHEGIMKQRDAVEALNAFL